MSDDTPKIVRKHISALRFDPVNARKHNPRNVGMIERSLHESGAGRSLLVSADGTVIAGNATLEAAAAAGFEDVLIVPTDGRQLVVVQRTDLDAHDEQAIKLALYDNRTAELAEWYPERIAELSFDAPQLLEGLFTDDEVTDILKQINLAGDTLDADDPADDASLDEFVAFKFGDYAGRVSTDVYNAFVDTYEREKEQGGLVMLDDVLRLMMGL